MSVSIPKVGALSAEVSEMAGLVIGSTAHEKVMWWTCDDALAGHLSNTVTC